MRLSCLSPNPVCVAVVDVDETLIETDELSKILDDQSRETLENISRVLLSTFVNNDLLDILESGKFTDIVILSNNSSDWYVNEVARKIRLPPNCKLWVASANHESRRRISYTLPDGRTESCLVKDLATIRAILGRDVSLESILFFDDVCHVLSDQLKQNNLNRQFVKVRIRHPIFQKLQTPANVKNAINWIEESIVVDAYKNVLGYSLSDAKTAARRLMCQNVAQHSHSDRKTESYIPRSRVLRELSFLCDQLQLPFWRAASFLKNGLSSKVALAFEGKHARQCELYTSPLPSMKGNENSINTTNTKE